MGRMTQPPYLVFRNFKTMIHVFKVTPLIWASEGQNNESKSYEATQIIRGGTDEVWQMTQDYNFFMASLTNTFYCASLSCLRYLNFVFIPAAMSKVMSGEGPGEVSSGAKNATEDL